MMQLDQSAMQKEYKTKRSSVRKAPHEKNAT